MIFVGKKPPEKSMEDFKEYYLERHAPLFLKTVPQVRKYTINFPVARPGKEPAPFDFITEIWWDDMESVRAFYKSAEYRDVIQPDEVKLGAVAQGVYFDEYVQK
jgi:uncharacterized protein (TIGR02118 family)